MSKKESAQSSHTPTPGTGLVAMAAEAARVEALILALAEQNEGEIDAALEQYLNEIGTHLAEKTDQYKFVMDRLKMTTEMLFAQAEQFEKAGLATEHVVESMRDRIKTAMGMLGTEEVQGKTWRFKLSNTAPRLVMDEEKADEHSKKVIDAASNLFTTARKLARAETDVEEVGLFAELETCEREFAELTQGNYSGAIIRAGIDKEKVKELLATGQPAPFGARLEGGKALRSYIVKAKTV